MDVRTFLAEFGHIANAPGGVQRLREMILQLAVQGRLVERLYSEGHANDAILIATEKKAEYALSKKLRKSKPLASLRKDEIPFAIPTHWKWERLDNIACYIQRGKSPKYDDSSSCYVVSQKCVQWTGFDLSLSRGVNKKSLVKYGVERYLVNGDLLWNSTGTGTAGRICVYEENDNIKAVADSHVTVIRLSNFIPRYIWCFIASPGIQSRIIPGHENSLVSGTTNQVELSAGSVKALPIPCPPLEEQKRIVAKVDELMALCDRLEAQQQKRSELTILTRTAALDPLANAQSPHELKVAWNRVQENLGMLFERPEDVEGVRNVILQLAVEGYITSTKDELSRWKKIKLMDCVKDMFTGPFGSALHKKDYIDNGTPVLNPSHIVDGTILPNWSVTVDKKTLGRLSKYRVIENDIILGRRGEMGRCAVVKPGQSGWLCGTGSMIIRPNSIVFPEFLAAVIRSPSGKLQLGDNSVGMTMSNLNQKALKKLSFLLPPYEVQKEIIKRYGEFMALCDTLESQLTQARSIAEKLARSAVSAITGT